MVKPKIEIPALTAGASGTGSSTNSARANREAQIRALEAKLKQLESSDPEFEINKTASTDPPLIQKYQFNKDAPQSVQTNKNRGKYHHHHSKSRHKPYDRRR